MRRLFLCLTLVLSWVFAVRGLSSARAAGFMMAEGQGQIIAGVGYIAAPRTFTRSGVAAPVPTYRKAVASAYLEYGLTRWLTLIAAPTAAYMHAGSGNAYTGSDETAFGGRLKLFGTADRTVALQALLEPPLGGRGDPMSEAAFGGPCARSIDLRLQYARALTVFGLPSFATIEPGARLREHGWPDEARLDLTFGMRPVPRLLVLAQSFNSVAHSAGPLVPESAYSKLQLSLVYDLSPVWSVQLGGIRTILGRNAAREFGPFASLWYRF